jgi:dynein light chain 1, axonemal
MAKSTSVKEALRLWEEKNGVKAADAEEVKLYGQLPPIEKMDSISHLKKCKHLSLSTNNIDRIANLQGLGSLEILSVGRNLLKNLGGLESVSDTLMQLWISYNLIEKLNGLERMKSLRVLYIGNNKITSWTEVDRLKALGTLEDLVLAGNPIAEDDPNYRLRVIKRLPGLKKLDGIPVDPEEREKVAALAEE